MVTGNWIRQRQQLVADWFLRKNALISTPTPKPTSQSSETQNQQENKTNYAILTQAFRSEQIRCKGQCDSGLPLSSIEAMFYKASQSAMNSFIKYTLAAYYKNPRVRLLSASG